MNKAEERALEAYPYSKGKVVATGFGTIEFDQNHDERAGFVQGYEQAEKDLTLTWEDIRCIVKIADKIVDEDRGKFMAMEDEDYYKEVLARYVKQSEKP